MPVITQRKLVFLDVETTGTNPHKHEVIELGCVVVVGDHRTGWKVLHELDIKIKPERIEDAEPEALRVNGYTPEAWMFAHTLSQALAELNTKAKDAMIVAHNVAFDYGFIDQSYRRAGLDSALHYHKLDTISIAFAKLHKEPDVKNWSLRALCDYFGIVNQNAHTALADARATYEVFKELMKM